MAPSADKLKGMQWKDAIPLEQKALQALLRAEATFRQIQVAFGQQGGGGGGGANSAGRDLASLFDLELDTEKNQYETAQTATPAEQHEKNVEDALAKLDALAKRQEELANQQHNPQQSFQERWQQEMLRREAEQLQRQMEQQLAQNGPGQQNGQQQSGQQSQQQGGQQSSGGSSSGQSGSQQQSASSQGGSQSSQQRAGNRQSSGQNSKQSSGQSGQSSDERVQQALSRLRQAGEAMKRNAGPQQNTDAARQAADKLREATNLLGGTQQQLASGKLGSLSHEAGRLTQEERAQADRINKLASQQDDSGAMDRDSMMEKLRQRNQLAGERQELSNDISTLQKNLRDTARQMAPTEPDVSKKLRDALTEMDQSDLDNHVQRTADWLRSGINPNSNGTESEIAQGLQKLDQQLRQAQQGMGQSKPGQGGQGQGDETAALSQVERLRSQLEAMASSRNGNGQQQNQNGQGNAQNRNGQQRQNGNQPGQRGNQQGQNGNQQGQNSNQPGQPNGNGQQAGNANQSGQPGRGGQPGQNPQTGQLQRGGSGDPSSNRGGGIRNDQNGDVRDGQSGDIRYGGGGADSAVWGNINTGDNRYGQGPQRPVPLDASGNPADTERTYQQGMRELNHLRQMVHDDPEATKAVQELARQMQQLDPSRFPGNPAMVEQMHREMLSSLDRIELQLQRNGSTTDARTGKPSSVPAGYQDSVADYYRRLSKNP